MPERVLDAPIPATDVQWLHLDEAAVYCRTSYSTLRQWIRQGRIPATKVGRRVKIRKSDLEALMTAPVVDPVEAHIEALVAAAPPLSDSQIRRLQSLLGGVAA